MRKLGSDPNFPDPNFSHMIFDLSVHCVYKRGLTCSTTFMKKLLSNSKRNNSSRRLPKYTVQSSKMKFLSIRHKLNQKLIYLGL